MRSQRHTHLSEACPCSVLAQITSYSTDFDLHIQQFLNYCLLHISDYLETMSLLLLVVLT